MIDCYFLPINGTKKVCLNAVPSDIVADGQLTLMIANTIFFYDTSSMLFVYISIHNLSFLKIMINNRLVSKVKWLFSKKSGSSRYLYKDLQFQLIVIGPLMFSTISQKCSSVALWKCTFSGPARELCLINIKYQFLYYQWF